MGLTFLACADGFIVQDFDLRVGYVTFTVPAVVPGDHIMTRKFVCYSISIFIV